MGYEHRIKIKEWKMDIFLWLIRRFLPYITGLHRWLLLKSGGLVGCNLIWFQILVLENRGRKSRLLRRTPMLYARDGERILLFASNAGQERVPGWWLNLQSQPLTRVWLGHRRVAVRATQAAQEDHERLWPILLKACFWFEDYQEGTGRQIPIIVLEPV